MMALIAILASSPINVKAETIVISIAYGPDGGAPFFSYKLCQQGTEMITSELIVGGKTLEKVHFEGRSDLKAMGQEMIADFAKTLRLIEPSPREQKDTRKQILLVAGGSGFDASITISGSDETLTMFIERSVIVREIFEELSLNKPKAYRLWETPGPLSSFMTPLTPGEKTQNSRKNKPKQ